MGTHEFPTWRTLTLALALVASVATASEPPLASGGAASAAAVEETGEEKAKDPTTDFSVIPIPEIILDPNEGNTYGLMGVWLILNDQDQIQYMVAPDVRYNETKGVFPNLRLFGYPSRTRRYSILIGKSTTRDENYEIEGFDRSLFDGRGFVLFKFLYERDSTERFYGFGNDSKEENETNYTGEDLFLDVAPGYWILPHVNLSYRMRIRRYNVQPGQVDSVPYIGSVFPELRDKGIKSTVYWQHRLSANYDTRNSLDMPTEGSYANAYIEGADRHVGSSTSFMAWGLEWRNFLPFRGSHQNPILATRAFIDYVQGGTDTPFVIRNNLGGRRALRGFGGDRFVDFNRSLMTAELRTRVYQRRLFGVLGEIELAPFVEAGQVFRHVDDSPIDDLHVVGGLGIRAIVRPQIVAFVDVGYGSEGDSIFTGIDYPF